MANASRIITKTSQALNNRITKSPPAAWQALLAHPPPPSLTRAPVNRTPADLPLSQKQKYQQQQQQTAPSRKRKPGREYKARLKPQPIVWDEDAIVDKLLADHPWEQHRAVTVTEAGELKQDTPTGEQARALASWSRNPSIHLTARYVLHLKEAYSMPLAQAYSSAVAQFRTLKATLEGASRMAQLEAEAYGAQFGPGRIGAGAKAEEKMLDLWDAQHGLSTTSTSDSGASSSSASFASIMAGAGAGDQPPKTFGWTGGKAYLRPGALSQSSTANTTHTSATNASLAEEPQTSESVLDAVHLMDVLGGTSSGGGPAPQSQEAKDKALHQNIQAKAKQKQRATARKITQMAGVKR